MINPLNEPQTGEDSCYIVKEKRELSRISLLDILRIFKMLKWVVKLPPPTVPFLPVNKQPLNINKVKCSDL